MGDFISQEEINALLNGAATEINEVTVSLTTSEKDALGEVGNVGMGTSATTLSTILDKKVTITAPNVQEIQIEDFPTKYPETYVSAKIEYTKGIKGVNFLFLKENDVKKITDIMMGGDGTNIGDEINALHLSAIGEAMNQMIGSSSTAIAQMIGTPVDISPPKADILNFSDSVDILKDLAGGKNELVLVSFKLIVEDLIDSELMQLMPLEFSKEMASKLLGTQAPEQPAKQSAPQQQVDIPTAPSPQPVQQVVVSQPQQQQQQNYSQPAPNNIRQPVNVQPANFQAFEENKVMFDKKNVDIIMDVPLQVTVELGRTNRLIKDILEFSTGTIIELDKLAGEPVDILVNGKVIAKGEVVVIDESFGVRVTEIVQPSMRL